MILTAVLIGTMTVTAYQPIPSQTDSSPTWTSIGDRTTMFGAAVSEDLLSSGRACYGDVLIIEGQGARVVNDVMHPRHKRAIDLLVNSFAEEHAVGRHRRKVWVFQSSRRFCEKKDDR